VEKTLRILLSSLKQGITSNRQLAIMLYLAESPEGKVDYIELVRHVVGDKPAATQALKVMGRLGFTKCERQPYDRRKRFVSLTEQGHACISALEAA
jgi:DNA-binding MarR family transcriptional regulator